MLKIGDIIQIYENPLSETNPEGRARLLELLIDDQSMQYWRVEFVEDGEQANRWIRKETKQS